MKNQRLFSVTNYSLHGVRELARFTIHGQPARKSNQRRIVVNNNTGRPMLIKSQAAMDYADAFLSQVPLVCKQGYGSLEQPLMLEARIFYASNRPDLSVELITDLLQEAGVIANDRYIKAHVLLADIDKEDPRAEIALFVRE